MDRTHVATTPPDLAIVVAELAEEIRRLHPRVAYRVEDAAEMVGVSRSEMYRLVSTGRVRKVPDMGVKVVIPHSELVRVFAVNDGPLRAAS